ncbi:MAG: CotH kinase family protein [Deltaproteobacteria bacterium]|nr:CotH kinase family protein [Deltaproteobacteria bacterium]
MQKRLVLLDRVRLAVARAILPTLLASGLGGCGHEQLQGAAPPADVDGDADGGDPTPGDPTPPPPPPTNLERSAALFDPERVLEISIELDPQDWDELRHEARSFFDVVGSNCLEAPPPSPFTYFPATVTVDGVTVTNVGVRKKGFFGSLDETKPSLKINIDEYVLDQRLSGVTDITLNNNKQDPANLRQCLGFGLFAKASVPSPRCNFAKVVVNGRNLGVYSHVEALKKQFLEQHFADKTGNLYEGALSDLRDGWVETFQVKTNDLTADRSDLRAFTAALQSPDDQLVTALAPYVDIDRFVTFWVMELLLGHGDGYARNANNFYLYHDPATGQLNFLPWGIDSTFVPMDGAILFETAPPPTAVWAEGALAYRLYRLPWTQTKYFARLAELLDTVWQEGLITADIDRFERLLSPEVDASLQDQFALEVETVRAFVRGRRAPLTAALSVQAPAWDKPLRDAPCVSPIGTVDGTFSTTWGTVGAADPFATGTATLTPVYPGSPSTAPLASSAAAGLDANTGEYVIQLFNLVTANTIIVAHLVVNEPLFGPGVSLPVDWVAVSGMLYEAVFNPGVPPAIRPLGMIADGTLDLSAAAATVGAPVVGELSSLLYESLF